MTAVTGRTERPERPGDMVFDRAHLEHYTMYVQGLAAEVLNLFMAQLPATITLLEESASAEDWKFACHALKGSAGSVGAQKLRRLAAELEAVDFDAPANLRLLRLQGLRAAAAEFREAVRRAYPSGA